MQPEDAKVNFLDGSTAIVRAVSDTSPTFYVNNATFGLTQWDIKVDLSELQGIVKEENSEFPVMLINRKVRLVMTPSYAKVFATTLLAQVARHEEMGKKIEEAADKPKPAAPVKDPEPSSK